MKKCLLILFSFFTIVVFSKENYGLNKEVSDKPLQQNQLRAAAAGCAPATAQTDLDINNIRTAILAGGDMWWDLSAAHYEVP